ncbi:PHP domain-containing protein, partial [bacterium]
NTVAGAARHAWACKKYGLKAIFGTQISLDIIPRERSNLTLLAANQNGYANLCDHLTQAHRNAANSGDRTAPAIGLDSLRDHVDGLFALTGGHDGTLSRLIELKRWSQARDFAAALKAIFGGRLFIELTHRERSTDNERLKLLQELAETLQISTVASNDVRHATKDEYAVYDAQTCRRLGLTVSQWHRDRPRNEAAYLCSAARLEKIGLSLAAIANSDAIARECNVSLLPGEVAPPHASIPSGSSAITYFKSLCIEGLKKRGLEKSRRAKELLRKECDIICQLGLEEFFLVVREVVVYVRSVGIRCSGRGSAANSLVAFLLGITEVDPIKNNLLFERFLHEGRRGMPDIDVDFDTVRRGEVIEWMARNWGEEHTAMTANVNTYRLRMAIRDFGKVLGYPLPLLDLANKHLPHAGVRKAFEYKKELAEVLGESVALDTLLHLCTALHDGEEASPRHLSLHSGGMVLSREPLRYLSPIQTSAN